MNNFRVYLRAFEAEDYKTTLKWRNDTEIWNMVVSRRFFVSAETEKQWINNTMQDNANNVKLAVNLKENNKHIGNVYLTDIDWFNRSALLGKLIGEKELWGKDTARK
jgi:RimJ/RimL family protein N-acetyltransferase